MQCISSHKLCTYIKPFNSLARYHIEKLANSTLIRNSVIMKIYVIYDIYVIIMATAMACSILAKEPSETEKMMKFVHRLTTCFDLYLSEKKSYCENMNNEATPWIINCATAYDKDLKKFFADCSTRLGGNDIPEACLVNQSDCYKFQACVTTGVTKRLSEMQSVF
ncbi:Uncharacterised protein g353 [Pycnogonum litorale]